MRTPIDRIADTPQVMRTRNPDTHRTVAMKEYDHGDYRDEVAGGTEKVADGMETPIQPLTPSIPVVPPVKLSVS